MAPVRRMKTRVSDLAGWGQGRAKSVWVTAALLSLQAHRMPKSTGTTGQGPCVATAPSAMYVSPQVHPPGCSWNLP